MIKPSTCNVNLGCLQQQKKCILLLQTQPTTRKKIKRCIARTKLASSQGTGIPVGTPGHSGRKLKPVVWRNQIRCSLACVVS